MRAASIRDAEERWIAAMKTYRNERSGFEIDLPVNW
jgi:hypothetical protein